MTRSETLKRYKEAYQKLASGQYEPKDLRDFLIILNGEMSNLQNLRDQLKERDLIIEQLKMNNPQLGLTLKDLETYKFDTSKYVILNDGVRRDPETGCLIKN